MIRIGVIGDIGSGKSYISKNLGFPIFNADKEVNKIYKNNRNVFKKLKKKFPKYINSFPLDKKEISKVILKRRKNIKIINKIIHPEVSLRMKKFINKNKKKRAVILDIPLLLEGKINKKSDILIFVEAKKIDINKRILKRPGFNKEIFNKLKKFQLPLEFKKNKANFIIKNNFKSLSIKKKCKMIKKEILNYERNSS